MRSNQDTKKKKIEKPDKEAPRIDIPNQKTQNSHDDSVVRVLASISSPGLWLLVQVTANKDQQTGDSGIAKYMEEAREDMLWASLVKQNSVV